jgi:hypothetical protein
MVLSILRRANSSDNSLTIAVNTLTIFMVDWPFRQTVLIWTLKETLLHSDGSKMAKQQTSVKVVASRAQLTAYFCCLLLAYPSTLKVVIFFSELQDDSHQTTWHYIAED